MTSMNFFKHVLLMFGLGASGVACGGTVTVALPSPDCIRRHPKRYEVTDLYAGRLPQDHRDEQAEDRYDARQELDNYLSLIDQQLVIRSDAASSPLVRVPSTGMATSGALHVTTLTGSKLTKWQTWINAAAPF